jgi:cytochrome c peroxidase
MVSGPPHAHLGGWGWDGRPAHKMRAMEVPIHSPLEGNGFELSVPAGRKSLLEGARPVSAAFDDPPAPGFIYAGA